MNILNRILLFLLSLTVAAASLLVLLFCLGTFPAPVHRLGGGLCG